MTKQNTEYPAHDDLKEKFTAWQEVGGNSISFTEPQIANNLITEFAALKQKADKLAAALELVTSDLEAEIKGRNPDSFLDYPSERRRFNRDMTPVNEAKQALADYRGKDA